MCKANKNNCKRADIIEMVVGKWDFQLFLLNLALDLALKAQYEAYNYWMNWP